MDPVTLQCVESRNGPWTKRTRHQVVSDGESLYLMGGFDGEELKCLNDVWRHGAYSNEWSLVCRQAGWSGRDGHVAVVFKSKLYVVGGSDQSDVWCSSDGGGDWVLVCRHATWSPRWKHACCVHNGKIYVSGGWGNSSYHNDVWSSTDGQHWILVTNRAPWKARMLHAMVSFKGFLYLLGGSDGTTHLSDVWASTDDGKTWLLLSQSAPWSGRQGHCVVVVQDHLYLLGGFGGSSCLLKDTMWRSHDCVIWQPLTDSGGHDSLSLFPACQGHSATAHRDQIFITGGFLQSGYSNSCYVLTPSPANNTHHSIASAPTSIAVPSSVTESTPVIAVSAPVASLSSVLQRFEKLVSKRSTFGKLKQTALNVIKLVETASGSFNSSMKCVSGVNSPDQESLAGQESQDLALHTMRCASPGGDRGKMPHMLPSVSRNTSSTSLNLMNKLKQLVRCDSTNSDTVNCYPVLTRDNSVMSDVGYPLYSRNNSALSSDQWKLSVTSDREGMMMPLPLLFRDISVMSEESKTGSIDSDSTTSRRRRRLDSALLKEKTNIEELQMAEILRKLRLTAESGNLVEMSALLERRSSLAKQSLDHALPLLMHVSAVRAMHDERNDFLTTILSKLESIASSYTPSAISALLGAGDPVPRITSSSSLDDGCTLSEWEEVKQSTTIMLDHTSASSATDAVMMIILNNMKVVSTLGWTLSETVESNLSTTTDSNLKQLHLHQRMNIHNHFPATLQPVDSKVTCRFEDSLEYETSLTAIGKDLSEAEEKIDLELSLLSRSEDLALNQMRTMLMKSMGMLKQLIHQSNLNVMEVRSMESDTDEWLQKVKAWMNEDELSQRCVEMINEMVGMEDRHTKLNNKRIDLKSKIDKMSLSVKKSKKAQVPYNIFGSTGNQLVAMFYKPEDDCSDSNIAELNQKLLEMDITIAKMKRRISAWYRDHREYAVNYCPELFYYLPSMRSVLGDTEFIGAAQLPSRHFYDYENVRPLVIGVMNQSSGPQASSEPSTQRNSSVESTLSLTRTRKEVIITKEKRKLYKATIDSEEVVLKCFYVLDHLQCLQFEREISVLKTIKYDSISRPRAIVETKDVPSYILEPFILSLSGQIKKSFSTECIVFVEFPFYKWNLADWLNKEARKPWEKQSVMRQILYAVSHLHDHDIVHNKIKPSNVFVRDDDLIVLSDFEGSFGCSSSLASLNMMDLDPEGGGSSDDGLTENSWRSSGSYSCGPDDVGFVAPEVLECCRPSLQSDMYSCGALLYYLHFPAEIGQLIPGTVRIPSTNTDFQLEELMRALLSVDPSSRPSASSTLVHGYFRSTFVDSLYQSGEFVEKERRLDAVRRLISSTRAQHEQCFYTVEIDRQSLLQDMLDLVASMPDHKMRHQLKIKFKNEAGIDEGGLLTEVTSLFFEKLFSGEKGLFDGANESAGLVLPSIMAYSPQCIKHFVDIGRYMVKILYEGKRMGSRLSTFVFKYIHGLQPSMRDLQLFDPQTAKSLQWILTAVGVEELGMEFEEVGAAHLGAVNDNNKEAYVMMKVSHIMVGSRVKQLEAIKKGFISGLTTLSPEASPFLTLLSPSDWCVMLCGSSVVNASQIIACLEFVRFPSTNPLPQWLKDILINSSQDLLRKFLIFVTGTPCLDVPFARSINHSVTVNEKGGVLITVRLQSTAPQTSLPIAHTCFHQLELPNYSCKEEFTSKLVFAIENAITMDIS